MTILTNSAFPSQYNVLSADCVPKDVTIICKDGQFRASRLVLAAAMPALHSVLQEQVFIDSVITIRDFNSDFIKDWLKFIHSGSSVTKSDPEDIKTFFNAVGFRKRFSISNLSANNNDIQQTEALLTVKRNNSECENEATPSPSSPPVAATPNEAINTASPDSSTVENNGFDESLLNIPLEPVKKKRASKKKKADDIHRCKYCKKEFHCVIMLKKHVSQCQLKIFRCFPCSKRFLTKNKMQEHMSEQHRSKGTINSQPKTVIKKENAPSNSDSNREILYQSNAASTSSVTPQSNSQQASTSRSEQWSVTPKKTNHSFAIERDKRTCFDAACQTVFGSARLLREHIKTIHGSPGSKPRPHCTDCNETFRTHKNIRIHKMSVHYNQGIKCDVCSQFVLTQLGLTKHKNNCPGSGLPLSQNASEFLIEISMSDNE